jgi:hypothetical protein
LAALERDDREVTHRLVRQRSQIVLLTYELPSQAHRSPGRAVLSRHGRAHARLVPGGRTDGTAPAAAGRTGVG